MKKRIVLLIVCGVLLTLTVANHLYNMSREDDKALEGCTWLTVKDPYSIRIQFHGERDGILPIEKPFYMMTVYDWGTGAEPLLGGYEMWEGSWIYDGNWSLEKDIVTLKTNKGETILGTVKDNAILLDIGGGYLLEKFTVEE